MNAIGSAIRGGQTGEWTTDAGWGCMLRTTQMMFCQGLIIHYLGRHWRLSNHKEQDPLYTMVLKWFLDYPVGVCPYSIHNLLKHAGVVDKKVGQWFGPQAASVVMSRAHKIHQSSRIAASLPKLYMATDGTLYLDQIIELCTEIKTTESTQKSKPKSSSSEIKTPNAKFKTEQAFGPPRRNDSTTSTQTASSSSQPTPGAPRQCTERKISAWEKAIKETRAPWKSIIILIPVRLGIETINQGYCAGLKECLRLPQSLGFVGGRPRSSLYFMGYQGENLLYLDPHTIQRTISLRDEISANIQSFHCTKVQTLRFSGLDPSLALGFYCSDRDDFFDFWRSIERMNLSKYPTFRGALAAPNYDEAELDFTIDSPPPKENQRGVNVISRLPEEKLARKKSPVTVDDGFVLL
ncbi:hypothetical protein AAMO2058_000855200 [Amorphochlora amoebiformis]